MVFSQVIRFSPCSQSTCSHSCHKHSNDLSHPVRYHLTLLIFYDAMCNVLIMRYISYTWVPMVTPHEMSHYTVTDNLFL